jgi:hypothetical protein
MDISFPEFDAAVRHLYANGDYAKIIDLIDQRGQDFPDQRLYLTYWQIGMAARMRNFTFAYHLMDTLSADDHWIDRNLMLQSPSLEGMIELQDYTTRLDRFWELQQREFAQLLPLVSLHQEEACRSGEACPLLLGLHDDRQIAIQAVPYWRRLAAEGWLVGLPQSSQALWSLAYVWEDRDRAQREVSENLEKLQQSYLIDPRRIISAGHGASGELALWLPLSNGIDVRGMIAVNPHGAHFNTPDNWLRLMQATPVSGLRAAIIIHLEKGSSPAPELKRTLEIFNIFDLPSKLITLPPEAIPGSEVYETALLDAVDFILT